MILIRKLRKALWRRLYLSEDTKGDKKGSSDKGVSEVGTHGWVPRGRRKLMSQGTKRTLSDLLSG